MDRDWKKSVFGTGLALLVGGLAKFLSQWASAVGDVSIAIVLGILLANICRLPDRSLPGIRFCEKNVLSCAVMLMGFGLNLEMLLMAGWMSLFFLTLTVVFAVGVSFVVGKMAGVGTPMSLLIGMGNAICGASAVAASAPLLTNKKEEIGIAVSVVNLLGTLGIFILPLIVSAFGFDVSSAGLLVGGTLQAVGHVVAAGYAVSQEVGELSLAIKMGRIFLLAPALVILALLLGGDKSAGNSGQKREYWFQKLPLYLYGFMACALLANLRIIPGEVLGYVKFVSHHLLLVAMAAVGLQIRFSTLVRQGPRALAVGAGAFLLQVLLLVGMLSLSKG